jgi:hypothetical protein
MAKLVQSPEDAGVLVAAEVVGSSGSESKEDVAWALAELEDRVDVALARVREQEDVDAAVL